MQLTATTPADHEVGLERCPLCHDSLRGPALHVVRCRSCETPHHQTCLREFSGCGTIGCERRSTSSRAPKPKVRVAPRAGAAAEPQPSGGSWGLAVFSLVLAWLSVPLLWPVGLLVTVATTLGLGVRNKRRPALTAFLLCPVVVLPFLSVVGATGGYWTGTALFRGAGLPGPNYGSLDPVVRCSKRSSGCMVDGSEVLTHVPNNLALRFWGELCGPMPGAYDGPLPTLDEARAFVRWRGVAVKLGRGRRLVEVGGRPLEFDPDEWGPLTAHGELGREAPPSLWLAVYEERLLIVVGAERLLLIDLESDRVVEDWWCPSDPELDAPRGERRR